MTDAWRLGRLRLLPATRQLLLDGMPVALGGRAFDLLVALVDGRGQVLTKDALLARVWPGVVVEENNLTVQVSALRKLLGAEAIVTVAGRGYQLVLPVEPEDDPIPTGAPAGTGDAPVLPDRPSIAVLPFENRSGQKEDEYVCDGLSEDLVTELSRFRSLFVISRNSSFTYRGRVADVRTVGRELGVRYVLEGSVRRANRQLRINAQLVEAASGTQIWAERYDRQAEDIFALQEELTRAIVTAIAPQIDLSERSGVRRRAGNLTAYELALRAWAMLRDPYGGEDLARHEQARRLAREALAIDPASSLAARTIAWSAFSELWIDPTPSRVRAAEDAIVLASRVIAADSADHHAYHFRGLLQFVLGRCDAALLDLRRAHELNPNDAATMCFLGLYEALCGRPLEGRALATGALRLSPRDPQRYLLLNQLAGCCFAAGDSESALAHALQATAEATWFPGPWIWIAMCRAERGDLAGARDAVATLQRLAPQLLRARREGQWMGTDPALRERATRLLRLAAG